jgi:nucleoside 2-deoxyribosyltransferase
MRIYLACTVRGDRAALPAVRELVSRLEKHGHEVLTSHLLRDDVERVEATLSEAQVYERDMRWLQACDAVVAEASGSSYGVGFEVGYVLGRAAESRQRVFLLYDARRREAISRLIAGNTDPRCVRFAYPDVAALGAFIDEHFAPTATV